jgi:hypothetical protein
VDHVESKWKSDPIHQIQTNHVGFQPKHQYANLFLNEKLQGSNFSKLKGDVEYKIHEKQNSKRRNKTKTTFPKKSLFQLFELFSSHILYL